MLDDVDVVFEATGEVSRFEAQKAAVDTRHPVMRLDGDRAVVVRERLGNPTRAAKAEPTVEEEVAHAIVDRDRAIELRERVFTTSELTEREAAAVVRLCVRRRRAQRRFEKSQSVLVTARIVMSATFSDDLRDVLFVRGRHSSFEPVPTTTERRSTAEGKP